MIVADVVSFTGEFSFLSNFYPSPIKYEGPTWATVEHAYQAAKTLDMSEKKAIWGAATPGKAKQLGRKVEMRPDWEGVKLTVMLDLLRLKFADPTLEQQLVATYGFNLVEGNTWNDRFWGVCKGTGQNNLGKLLMQVRSERIHYTQGV